MTLSNLIGLSFSCTFASWWLLFPKSVNRFYGWYTKSDWKYTETEIRNAGALLLLIITVIFTLPTRPDNWPRNSLYISPPPSRSPYVFLAFAVPFILGLIYLIFPEKSMGDDATIPLGWIFRELQAGYPQHNWRIIKQRVNGVCVILLDLVLLGAYLKFTV